MDYSSFDTDPLAQSNETLIYATSDAVMSDSPSFDVIYESISALLFWVLLGAMATFGLKQVASGEHRFLKRWPIYFMILAYVVFTVICETIATFYSVAAHRGTASDNTYLAYIFFWHASSASFLVVLLALSGGYTITREVLEGELAKVMFIPLIVFIAGVTSDFTFVYVEESQKLSAAADRYNMLQMTPTESLVWILGSLANVMCFILAWVFIFDSTQLEMKALDDAQEALLKGTNPDATNPDSDDDSVHNNNNNSNGQAGQREQRNLGTTSQRATLLYGHDSSSGGQQPDGDRDVEQGEVKETFADHMEYTIKKTLLTRLWHGVCAYLLASILVILVPAFFNAQVQNLIVVLQFIVKYLFTIMLAYIFRPGRDSPYLQIGRNDTDADEMGVSALDTELAITDYRDAEADSTQQQAATTQPGSSTAGRAEAAAAGGGAENGKTAATTLPVSTGASTRNEVREGLRKGRLPPEEPPSQGKPKFTLDEDDA